MDNGTSSSRLLRKKRSPINTHDVIHVAAEERIMQMKTRLRESGRHGRCNQILEKRPNALETQGEPHTYLSQGSDRDFRETAAE